ncbi:hypothetical protein FHR70_004419 [Microvirga lupini]|uniref:Uncharacterized protein n=1 Tax=Microvirga lupini TaxID=420324 RepID=A0A7W4YZS5_9HYPH|nr:hypothetical protein [Microvirga lupini]
MSSVVSAGAYLSGNSLQPYPCNKPVRGSVKPIRHLQPTDGRRRRPALSPAAADFPPSQVSHKDLAADRYEGEWRFQTA